MPAATRKTEVRYQASVHAASYTDNFSGAASALLDLREFEIGVRGSQRLVTGTANDDQSSASLELARNYVGDTGIFGRMGIEAFHFFPSTRRWVKLGFSTGRVSLPSQPWEILISTNVFVSITGAGAQIGVRGETGRSLSDGSPFSLGGFINWNLRNRPADKVGRYEHMLFSFGPLLEWRTGFGKLKAQAPLRLWIDRDLYLDKGNLLTARPSEFSPDFAVSWTIVL